MDTFGDRAFHVMLSSPTSRHGHICQELDTCPIVLQYHVPCRHCGVYDTLRWAQVFWPDCPDGLDEQRWSRWIELEDAARYSCPHCEGVIKSHDRAAMLLLGVWAVEGEVLNADTIETARQWLMEENDWDLPRRYTHVVWPKLQKSPHVGIRINGLYSPWLQFSQPAAEYIRVRHVPHDLQNFHNSRLGEPYEQTTTTIEADQFAPRIRAGGLSRLALRAVLRIRKTSIVARRGSAEGKQIVMTFQDAALWLVDQVELADSTTR